jgi:hypothetical protein
VNVPAGRLRRGWGEHRDRAYGRRRPGGFSAVPDHIPGDEKQIEGYEEGNEKSDDGRHGSSVAPGGLR